MNPFTLMFSFFGMIATNINTLNTVSQAGNVAASTLLDYTENTRKKQQVNFARDMKAFEALLTPEELANFDQK